MSNCRQIRYVLISPVKDEENYIASTIESVLSQSILPEKWIIVDDGSSDNTKDVIEKYCGEFSWVKLICLKRDRERMPGPAVINAFNVGYDEVKSEQFEYIVKLDGDLKFGMDYFENLIKKFMENRLLGIASGVYYEQNGNAWVSIPMPTYHAAGASKVIRRKCFEDIGGFVLSRGWDTVDEIKAMIYGWETRHYADIHFYHLKKEGSGIGNLRTNIMHGEIYYLTGGSRLFFLFKFAHRLLFGDLFLISGLFMLYGYFRFALINKDRLVSKEEMRLYRGVLKRRITDKLSFIGGMRRS